MMTRYDDYLWDPGARPDPFIARLEHVLAWRRHRPLRSWGWYWTWVVTPGLAAAAALVTTVVVLSGHPGEGRAVPLESGGPSSGAVETVTKPAVSPRSRPEAPVAVDGPGHDETSPDTPAYPAAGGLPADAAQPEPAVR